VTQKRYSQLTICSYQIHYDGCGKYIALPEYTAAIVPQNLDMMNAGTVPGVG
jgi:hypothetical protein